MLVSPVHDGGSLRPIDWETLKDGGNSISCQMTERLAARCLSACLSLVYLCLWEGEKEEKKRGKASLSQMFRGLRSMNLIVSAGETRRHTMAGTARWDM